MAAQLPIGGAVAWEEWEQAKAGAAGAQPVHMQLNEAAAPEPGGGGSGAFDLVVDNHDIGVLGSIAYELRMMLMPAGDHAKESTALAASHLSSDGCTLMGEALGRMNRVWDTQINTLETGCAHVSNHCDYTRAEHAKDEEKIKTEMRNAGGKLLTPSRIYDYIK